MEQQSNLIEFNKEFKFENMRHLLKPVSNKKSLEWEKRKFLQFSMGFIDLINFKDNQVNGRPKFLINDIIKSLLIMSYNKMSYRRAESDLTELYEKGLIQSIPSRAVLNKYMLQENTKKIIENLIQVSALFFVQDEDTLILDSTWLACKMYSGGYKKVYDKKNAPLQKVRKLHVACLKESRIIACAKATTGTVHDSPMFKDLVYKVYKNGFNIKRLLADAGYMSKDNYNYCYNLNIESIFIDFKSNVQYKRAKSPAWKKSLKIYKENPKLWHENYRFRVLVEGVFSAMKRKQLNYLRSRKGSAQDCELLLKCLIYNFTIIGKSF